LATHADLAQTRQLDDEDFLRYLDYLKYWQRPQYCRYIAFPHCLRFLELLQEPAFRQALKRPDFKEFVATQQHAQWRYRLPVLDAARAELRAQLTD
jgi:mediator of RNA polymerase II transcription subunit 31